MKMDTGRVETIRIGDDGTFPNNGILPLMVYRGAVTEEHRRSGSPGLAAALEETFTRNGWPAAWRDSIFTFHHYHSTTHEVLGIYCGSATVQFGGPAGPVVQVETGDVIVIPAGVSHKRIDESPDFAVVGAYPGGRHPDMKYGRAGERPGADEVIRNLPLPDNDPLEGRNGPLRVNWK